MNKDKEEGNLVSFRIFLARDGNIISEFKYLPLEEAETIFKKEEALIIQKILKEGKLKLENLHDHIEKEVQALWQSML